MKAVELTYGALVRLKRTGQIVRVKMITRHKIGYHLQDDETTMHYARLWEILPVELTREIVERNSVCTEPISDTNVRHYMFKETVREDFPEPSHTVIHGFVVYIRSFEEGDQFYVQTMRCVRGIYGDVTYVHELQRSMCDAGFSEISEKFKI